MLKLIAKVGQTNKDSLLIWEGEGVNTPAVPQQVLLLNLLFPDFEISGGKKVFKN